jgi:hypothetical protein
MYQIVYLDRVTENNSRAIFSGRGAGGATAPQSPQNDVFFMHRVSHPSQAKKFLTFSIPFLFLGKLAHGNYQNAIESSSTISPETFRSGNIRQ